ncbi:MAG: hypothetical protein QM756_35795 [Polyangiaceae bacterium]
MADSASPNGRFQISVSAWEARMSHWIETPTLTDVSVKETILSFEDASWSLDDASWIDDSRVTLVMRKYPGNHKPSSVSVEIDCIARTATLGEREVKALQDLERAMNAAIEFY